MWNGSITVVAVGSFSLAAVLNLVNLSIATTFTPSRHALGRGASHALNAALGWPSTMSSNLAGPVPARIGVRSLELRRAVTEGGSYRDPLEDAQLWSAAWAGAGVICDAVSAQVLVLNLPLTGNAPAVRLCHAAPGEPVWLTLRSLRGDWELARGAEVFVCENPTVLEAAADRHGAASRPLVCTFGLPSQAAWELLTGLGDVRCHVRADGDAVGWRIVNQLRDRLPGALTWRMPEGCTAYEEELLEDLLSDLKGDTLGP